MIPITALMRILLGHHCMTGHHLLCSAYIRSSQISQLVYWLGPDGLLYPVRGEHNSRLVLWDELNHTLWFSALSRQR